MATVLVQFVMRQEIDLAEKSYEMFPSAQTISISYPAKIQFEVEGKIELLGMQWLSACLR